MTMARLVGACSWCCGDLPLAAGSLAQSCLYCGQPELKRRSMWPRLLRQERVSALGKGSEEGEKEPRATAA